MNRYFPSRVLSNLVLFLTRYEEAFNKRSAHSTSADSINSTSIRISFVVIYGKLSAVMHLPPADSSGSTAIMVKDVRKNRMKVRKSSYYSHENEFFFPIVSASASSPRLTDQLTESSVFHCRNYRLLYHRAILVNSLTNCLATNIQSFVNKLPLFESSLRAFR